MDELYLNDFSLKNFPKDKRVIVYSHGNIYSQETNSQIVLILKEFGETNQRYFISYINLKDITNFPIGTVIDNQKKVNTYWGLEKKITINLENIESKILLQIPNLENEIITNLFPTKIGNFSSKYHIQRQYYFILKDINSNKTIYIPHYEIARWFYFTTPSMTRQILSAGLQDNSDAIKGLYKEIINIDSLKKEIILSGNANTQDAANIYRFAACKYANNSWYQIRRNLTASAIEIMEEKKRNKIPIRSNDMKLKVNFPIKQAININARVRELKDGSLLVLKFINEDSSYDFETLFVKLERKNKSIDPIGIVKKKNVRKKDLSKDLTTDTPSNEFFETTINDYSLEDEKRLGLSGKKIERRIDYIDDSDSRSSIEKNKSDTKIDLSTSDIQGNLNETTASGSITEEKTEDNNLYLTLNDFKNMLFECAKENDDFSFNILIESFLPQKPKNDPDKRTKWKKAKMYDGITKRLFIAILITYKSRNYIIIEIQRDSLVDGLSSLIIWDNDYSIIDSNMVISIARNFVQKNGVWLKDFEEFTYNKIFFEHPKGENNSNLKSWYERLLDKLK